MGFEIDKYRGVAVMTSLQHYLKKLRKWRRKGVWIEKKTLRDH